jgi:hypothetical protein
MKVVALALEFPFPYRNKQDCFSRPWYKELQFHIPDIYIAFPIDSSFSPIFKLLFNLHRLSATVKGSGTCPRHDEFCPAFLTDIPFSNLIGHI